MTYTGKSAVASQVWRLENVVAKVQFNRPFSVIPSEAEESTRSDSMLDAQGGNDPFEQKIAPRRSFPLGGLGASAHSLGMTETDGPTKAVHLLGPVNTILTPSTLDQTLSLGDAVLDDVKILGREGIRK
jgi:hypothetical protein